MAYGCPVITLSNGIKMPAVGLGTSQSTPDEVKLAVRAALDAGYRLIDTASAYSNEEAIGEVLQEYFTAGKLKREDIFVTTKAWSHEIHPNRVEGALRASLKKLQLDYANLYLVHMPVSYDAEINNPDFSVKVEDVWKAFEVLYDKGLVKAIGVSNHSIDQVERIMKIARIPIHNIQVELHLYFNQTKLQEVCKKHNISITSYGSLGLPARENYKLPSGQ